MVCRFFFELRREVLAYWNLHAYHKKRHAELRSLRVRIFAKAKPGLYPLATRSTDCWLGQYHCPIYFHSMADRPIVLPCIRNLALEGTRPLLFLPLWL